MCERERQTTTLFSVTPNMQESLNVLYAYMHTYGPLWLQHTQTKLSLFSRHSVAFPWDSHMPKRVKGKMSSLVELNGNRALRGNRKYLQCCFIKLLDFFLGKAKRSLEHILMKRFKAWDLWVVIISFRSRLSVFSCSNRAQNFSLYFLSAFST